MKAASVVTNLRCNQNCRYCTRRASEDDLAFIAWLAVKGRIDSAVDGSAREIVITGGEPTLRRDLDRIVAYVVSRNALPVLETNARAVDDALARRLADAGLAKARVNLSGGTEALDDVTRDPGGYRATIRGIESLAADGISVEIAVAVTRGTRTLLGDLPALVAGLKGSTKITGLLVVHPIDSPDPDEVLDYAEAVPIFLDLERRAASCGLSVRLAPGDVAPPCVFPETRRPSALFALTPGGAERRTHQKLDVCGRCALVDRCPGVSRRYVARFGVPDVSPVSSDRVRRRLSLIEGVEAQIARELSSPSLSRDEAGNMTLETIVRINFHCNQACRFCFVSTHLPAAGHEAIRAAIESAGASGARIMISGGEPTLNPRLLEYVELARRVSGRSVGLQTNAVKVDDELAKAVVAAGVDQAFVSLHGSHAELSDAITEAPGTFEKTVRGIDVLYRNVGSVILNFVICGRNYADLPELVKMVAKRWPRAFLTISFVAPSTDMVPRDRDMIPRYSEVLPALAEALSEAKRLDLSVGGFESMCGVPLCLVPTTLEPYVGYATIPEGFDEGELVKPSPCEPCDLREKCFGVRRGYVELHGAGELRPVRLENG